MKKSKAKKPKFNPLTIPANSEAINAAGYNIDSLNFMRRFDKAKILNISNTAIANLKGCQICSSLRSIIVKGSPLAETEYHRLTILIGLAPLATDIDFKKVTPEEQRTMKLIQEEAICPIFQGFVITGLSPLTLRRGDEKIVIPPEKCTTPSTLKFPELKALQTVQMIEQLSVQMHEAAIELKMDPIKKDDVDKLIEQTKQDAEKANERMKRIRENRKKMLEEKKAREEAQKEMEERKTKEIEEKRQKEIEERRARELEEKKQKEIEEQRKKELAEQKAKELEEKKKREKEEREAKKKQKALEEERKKKEEEIDENDRKEAEMRLQKELEATKNQKKSTKRDSLDLPVVEESQEQKPKAKLGKEKDVVDVDKVGCFAGRRESTDDDSAELIDFHRRSSKADKEIESDEPKKAKKESKKKKSKGKDKKEGEEKDKNKKSVDNSKKEKAKQSKEDEKKSDSSKKSSSEKKSSKDEDKKQEPPEKIVNEKKEKEEKKSDSSKKSSNEKNEKEEKKSSKDQKKSDSSKKSSDDKKSSKTEDKKAKSSKKSSSEKKEKDEKKSSKEEDKKQDPPKKIVNEKNKQSIPKNKSKDLEETFVIDAKEPFEDASKAPIDNDSENLPHPPKNTQVNVPQNAPPDSPTQDEKKPQTEEELRRQRLRERLMRMKANQQAKIEERKNQEAKQQESPVEVRPAFVDERSSDIESPPPKLPISDEDRTPPTSPQEQSPPRSPLPNVSPAFRKKLALIRARNDQRKETESPQPHQQSPFTRKVQISSPVEKDSGDSDSEEDVTKVQTKKAEVKKPNRSSLEGRLSIDSSGSEVEFGNAQGKKKVEMKQEKRSNRSSLEMEIPKKGRLSIDSSGSEEQVKVKTSMKHASDSSDSEKPMKSKKQSKKTENERVKTKKGKSKLDGTDSDEEKRPTKVSKKQEMPDPKRKQKISSESSESDERNKNAKPTKIPDPKRKRLSSFEEQTRNTKDPRRKPQNISESSDSESSESDKPKKQSRLKVPSSPPSPEWRYNRDQRDFGFKRRGSSPDSLGFASRKPDFDSSSDSFNDDQPEPFQREDHEVKREPSKMTPKFAKKLQEMRKKNIEQRKKSEEMEEPKVVLKPKNIEPEESPFIQPEFEPEEPTQKKKSRIPTPQRRPKTYAFKRSDSDSFEELDLAEDVPKQKKPTKQNLDQDITKKKPKANLSQKREQQPKAEPERKPEFQKKRPPPINTGKSKNETPLQIGITLTKTPVKKGEGGDSQDLPKLITKPKGILGKRGTESTPGTQKSVKLMQPDEPEDFHPEPPVQYRSPVEARKHVNSRLEAIRQRNQKLKVTAEEERMNDRMARIRATLKQKLSVQIRPEFLETPEEEIEEEEDEYEEDTVDYLRSPDSPIILKKTTCDSPEYEFGSSNIDKIMARARARVQQKDEKQRQTEGFGRYNSNSSDDEVDFSNPTPIKSTRRKSAVADDPGSPFSKKLLMANESGMISEFLELEAIAHNESASPHPKKLAPEPEQEQEPSSESYHIEEEEEFSQEEEEDFVLPEPEEDDFEVEDPYGALDEGPNDLGYEEEDFYDELTPSEEGLPSDLCESSTSSRAGIIPLDDVDLSLDVPSLNMDSPGTSPRSS